MAEGSVSDFFAFIDKQNNAIAAREAAAEPRRDDTGVGVDQHQIREDAKRREKLGQLRARERPGKRPHGMVNQLLG